MLARTETFMIKKFRSRASSSARSRGFSLLEMVVGFAILTIVIAVAVQSMIMMQTRNFAETAKVDTVQETRDFIDQMVRDVHDVGYPPPVAMAAGGSCVGNAGVSCGLIQFSSTQIKYEGDLDGTGTVYQVWVQLVTPASGNCPCILQRGVLPKATVITNPSAAPDYYTEVNGVLNSGNGSGAATYTVSLSGNGDYSSYTTQDVFSAFDNNAQPVASCSTVATCSSIRSLQISVNVAPSFMDQTTKMYPVFSITSKARLNNPPTS